MSKLQQFQDKTPITMELLEELGFIKQEKQPKTEQEWHFRFRKPDGQPGVLAAKPTLHFIQWYVDNQPFPRALCVTTLGRLRVICELLCVKLNEIE